MSTTVRRGINIVLGLACLSLIYLIATRRRLPELDWAAMLTGSEMTSFKILFLSIILEAFPFMLLGVLVSALLQVFVSEETIRRWTPKNPLLGILFGCTLGIVFPLCECGMIPVVRRLMLKGMPLYIAVVFIIAGPILNPVVYAATFMAFRSRPEITYSRMGLAVLAAVVIGLIIYRFYRTNPLRSLMPGSGSSLGSDHAHLHMNTGGFRGKVGATLSHASDEFFDMGKYLLFGALLTAGIQTLVARETLAAIGQGEFSSHLFMMGFAYVLSLCSTSDAFVASSFATTFSAGSLLTFLVFGPMLDIKNTLMLLSVFRTRFVLALTLLIVATVLGGSLLFEKFILS
ncbi:permease [Paenibacillus sp. y28]|uniref:permease n=1 Tax=Paenibacillus sp. y28 TaxID=3129110 RepID=UPI00301ADC88